MKKNILLTGFPGFLGDYIYNALSLSNNIYTLGLNKTKNNKHIQSDISQNLSDLPNIKFDIIIHCAGKAHSVPKTEREKNLFYKVNFQGTKNLIFALDKLSIPPKLFVFISTVAVYGIETGMNIDETYSLNGKSPYAKSKILAENFIQNWKTSANKIILRLPLVVGKNPPGNLCKMINAIKKGYYFNIAGGKAKRSMVLANDVAQLIPNLINHNGTYNLTDGYHPSFYELSSSIKSTLKHKSCKCPNIPYSLIKPFAIFGNYFQEIFKKKLIINNSILSKMTSDLTFSDKKAKNDLNWEPEKVISGIENIINKTI